jgi:HlyD family secretion protein
MFVRKYVIPLLAVAGVGLAVYTVRSENKPVIPAQPVAQPAASPFETPVAGAGIVESSTLNIGIGTHIPGIVDKVFVNWGDRVNAGDPLFTIDARQTRAELAVREAALLTAQQQLARLAALPRAEDVPPAEARVAEARALVTDARAQLTKMESVTDKRAVAEEEFTRRRNAVAAAEARLAEFEASLALLKAGAWAPDVAIARANVAAAEAQVQEIKTQIERLTVRAPVSGQVLQVNIRAGEFAQAGPLTNPLVMMGATDTLHVRVDVDENDAWRITPGAKATAFVRGNRDLSTELSFVRIDPYVIPKRSLTGDSIERVDTRVLQVIYAFPAGKIPVYVGQQMDVFIDGAAGAARQSGRSPAAAPADSSKGTN